MADIDRVQLNVEHGSITAEQYGVLMKPLNSNRVAHRNQGGKSLSYLESWDVRATLIRVFGFGNFDVEVTEPQFMGIREYSTQGDSPKPMAEVIWKANVTLRIRDPKGRHIAQYTECAVGSASGPANMLGEHHDNALKTAASDALKRCAINLGTQFGLGLYDNGATREVIRVTFVKPDGVPEPQPPSEAQQQALSQSVGTPAAEQTEEQAVAAAQEGLGATEVPEGANA